MTTYAVVAAGVIHVIFAGIVLFATWLGSGDAGGWNELLAKTPIEPLSTLLNVDGLNVANLFPFLIRLVQTLIFIFIFDYDLPGFMAIIQQIVQLVAAAVGAVFLIRLAGQLLTAIRSVLPF